MADSVYRQYPLLFRLVCYVLGFSLFIALLLSTLQLWLAYKGELSNIQQQLGELKLGHEKSLTKNIWNMDSEGVDIHLISMVQYPDVEAVVLTDNTGVTYQQGNIPKDDSTTIIERFPLTKQFAGETIPLGIVTLYATPVELKKRLRQEVSTSLLVEFIALLLTAVFTLLIFLFQFNLHINRIAEFAENLGITTLGNKLKLDRNKNLNSPPDELDRIVSSLNEMRTRLRDGVQAQQQTEHFLQREIAFSEAIINSLPGVFVVYDEQLHAVLFNVLYTQELAIEAEDAHEFSLMDRVVPEYREMVGRAMEDIFETRQQVSFEIELFSVDKKRVPYLFSGNFFELEGKKYIIGLGTDITDRKKMEEALNQAQKMELIGTLAGGIAHDFNNILSSIMGNLQLAQLASSNPDKLSTYLQSGVDASLRAKDLVGQILAMGRHVQHEKQPLQISLIIEETLKLLRATIPSSIEIVQELDTEGCIFADATQIHQVVMNLCTNAYQAMQESGGKLTVTLKEKNISDVLHLPAFDLQPGQYISLEVTDTGCGMDRETREKIFEPYFTTKENISGTGLGLAVVHGIVRAHDGHITLYSEPGQGTIFKVFFPLLTDPMEEPAPEKSTEEEFPVGTERLLFVDDENEILTVCSELVIAHGYSVDTFSNSTDALHHFQEDPSAYDLVVTDMTMPNLSGDLFGREIMTIRPDIPVIICSGFSKNMDSVRSVIAGFAGYLTKPVEAGELLCTIREVLDAATVKLNILLVDDELFNQEVVALLLETLGHQVVVAENGEMALQKIAGNEFDAVFMDMQMPVLDGLQATEIIRACEKNSPRKSEFEQKTGSRGNSLQGKHIPVIAITGSIDGQSKKKCLDAGMDDFLSKPFTLESVNEILQRFTPQNSTPTPSLPPNLPTTETEDIAARAIAYLAETYPLSEEQLQLLLEKSVLSLQESLQMAEVALAQGDFSQLSAMAHKMKGTLLGIGERSGVDVCQKLKSYAEDRDMFQSKKCVEQLEDSLQPLFVVL